MELTLGLDEALVAARASGALPTAVTDVRAEGAVVLARVAVHELPGVPAPIRMATRMAGPVDVRVEDRGITGRSWEVAIVAQHPVVRADLSSFVADAVRGQLAHLPPGVALVRTSGGAVVVDVDLDRVGPVVAGMLPGGGRGAAVHVEHLELGARLHVVARVSAT
ncbi:hypothetical protein [Cellulomonas sp. SLBN-39]|uniref:hypothetical protein n=1 Tax=Cellulomonas sp. SLBN-39 TaxID=2768446 RepID=UPI00114F065A|nr:hypothetical protein [Cellulomonas sp. SLBN-39]TQL02770.1 hypothetical protein FBY24_1852 [Cellulomonas sp. SLBN-39]